MIYLVVSRYNTIHSLYSDEDEARRNARAVRGVLVALPVTEDYRTDARNESDLHADRDL